MKQNTLILFISILLFFSWDVNAQVVFNPNSKIETPAAYYLQVKQFGEFIDRFNYISDWKGNLITPEFEAKMPRLNYIFFLLNSEDTRLSNPADSAYRNTCSDFIARACLPANPLKIELFKGQVRAKADVSILYMGAEQKVKMELLPEVLNDRSAKWVINGVEAKCFSSVEDSLRQNFLAPNSHETNFINLFKLNGPGDPLFYFSKGLATNETLLFLSELAKERIEILSIQKLSYVISFEGWEICVDEFIRETNNSGWLISDVKKLR